MKRYFTFILIAAVIGGAWWASRGWAERQLDAKVAKFNADADNLILGLQQYKEFAGIYPTGNNLTIAHTLLGQNQSAKKVIILSVRKALLNDKGEFVDPWGTPLQFYFSDNEVMIRSAGPNRTWEDSAVPVTDDLYRTAPKDK